MSDIYHNSENVIGEQKRRLSFSKIMKSCQEPRPSDLPPVDQMNLKQIMQELARIAGPFNKVVPEIVAKSYELGIQRQDNMNLKRSPSEVWVGKKRLDEARIKYATGREKLSSPEILQNLLESRKRNFEKLNGYRDLICLPLRLGQRISSSVQTKLKRTIRIK